MSTALQFSNHKPITPYTPNTLSSKVHNHLSNILHAPLCHYFILACCVVSFSFQLADSSTYTPFFIPLLYQLHFYSFCPVAVCHTRVTQMYIDQRLKFLGMQSSLPAIINWLYPTWSQLSIWLQKKKRVRMRAMNNREWERVENTIWERERERERERELREFEKEKEELSNRGKNYKQRLIGEDKFLQQ
jgi:hypothetical protein